MNKKKPNKYILFYESYNSFIAGVKYGIQDEDANYYYLLDQNTNHTKNKNLVKISKSDEYKRYEMGEIIVS